MSETLTPLMISLTRAADGSFEALARSGEATAQQQLRLPKMLPEPANLASAEQVGAQMGVALLSGPLGALYGQLLDQARASGGRIGIYLQIADRELTLLPWELLYDQQNARFVGLSARTLLARCATDRPMQPLTLEGPLRVLALSAGADGLPNPAEQAELNANLAALGPQIELRWAASWTDLQRELAGGGWHVLHIIAHDTLTEGIGRLALSDQQGAYRLGSAQLALLLEEQRALRLAIIDSRGVGSGARQIAAALARSGAAALALQRDPEHTLAQTIYGALLAGRPLEQALAEGRKTLALADPEGWLWGALLLALPGPNGVLFQRPQPAPAAPAMAVDNSGGVMFTGTVSGPVTTGDTTINQSGGVVVFNSQVDAIIGSAGAAAPPADPVQPPASSPPPAADHHQQGIQPIFVNFQRELRMGGQETGTRTALSLLLRHLERELLRGQRADLVRIASRVETIAAIDPELASALLAALSNPLSGIAPELLAAVAQAAGEEPDNAAQEKPRR